MHDQFLAFPTPRNLNYWWTFGGILTFMLAAQIATGVVLAMHYVPSEHGAFNSVEKIMRDVNWGWLLRYSHAVGASMFFVAVYIHTFRGLYYGSYKAPREVLWILGVLILLLMIATAFMGYSLVWGQMSFWAVTVITNLFSSLNSVVPGLGTRLVQWIWGGFSVGGPTLNRLYSLHYLFPFIIAGVVVLHIWALHIPGNNNPTGIDVKTARDTVPFHPYYTIKDGFALVAFIFLFAAVVFYAPNYLGHPRQLRPGQPAADAAAYRAGMVFPAVLRDPARDPEQAVRRRRALVASIGGPVLRAVARYLEGSVDRYRPVYRWFFWAFAVTCVALGYLGSQRRKAWYLILGRMFTVYYFAFFLVVMPMVGRIEKLARAARQHGRARAPRRGRTTGRQSQQGAVGGRLKVAKQLLAIFARKSRVGHARSGLAWRRTRSSAEVTSKTGLQRRARQVYDNAQLQRGYPGLSTESARVAIRCGCLSYRNLGRAWRPTILAKAVEISRRRLKSPTGRTTRARCFSDRLGRRIVSSAVRQRTVRAAMRITARCRLICR